MISKNYHIAVLPGNGIDSEVMTQALKMLDAVRNRLAMRITTSHHDVGGATIDNHEQPLPPATVEGCEQAGAVLLGSVGGPKRKHLPPDQQPERDALLPLCKHSKLFSNLRPAELYQGLKTSRPLRVGITANGSDILCVCELIGGIYLSQPRDRESSGQYEKAFGTKVCHRFEIERITRITFKSARKHHHKVTSVDEVNMPQSSVLWRKIVNEITTEYPDIGLAHTYVDSATAQLIKDPSQFDVPLCSNLFDDILSDEYAMIISLMRMLPSASLSERGFGLYEPTGGSTPDVTGKNIANPIAQTFSLALLLRYSPDTDDTACAIERTISRTLGKDTRTGDLARDATAVSTGEVSNIITRCMAEGV